MNSVVLFVEGEGDADSVPILVKKLVRDANLSDVLAIDSATYRVGGVEKFGGANIGNWTRKIASAIRKKGVAGILVVLDGDHDRWEGKPFCPSSVAKTLTKRAVDVGAGQTFSLACVFACQEYESWLLAGVESLAGRTFQDGRIGVKAGTGRIEGDFEKSPRDAKRALGKVMHSGSYKASIDQEHLTRLVDIEAIRSRGLRSFRRLEHAIIELGEAFRSGKHILSPAIADERTITF